GRQAHGSAPGVARRVAPGAGDRRPPDAVRAGQCDAPDTCENDDLLQPAGKEWQRKACRPLWLHATKHGLELHEEEGSIAAASGEELIRRGGPECEAGHVRVVPVVAERNGL